MRAGRIKSVRQARRVRRVRKKISGTPQRPRLAVSRSHRSIHAQVIDDSSGRTLCAAYSQGKELRGQIGYGGNRQAAAVVPDDRIMVETDAPYLSPEPVRKMKTNEPANVAHVARCLARVRGAEAEDFAELTTANATSFFALDINL